MISSLLERSSKRVVIDRIVKDDNSDIVLVNQKEEVLEEVRNHFKKQFRKRNTRASDMPSRWKEVYNPLEKVNSRIYDSLGNKISEERSGDLSVVVRLPDRHAIGLGFKSHCRRI